MKSLGRSGMAMVVSVVVLALMFACSGGDPIDSGPILLPNGQYERSGGTPNPEADSDLSRFIPLTFSIKGSELTAPFEAAPAGKDGEITDDDVVYVPQTYLYAVTDGELFLVNRIGDTLAVFSFETKDDRTVIIGGQEFQRK